jgi:hypothetical protein
LLASGICAVRAHNFSAHDAEQAFVSGIGHPLNFEWLPRR